MQYQVHSKENLLTALTKIDPQASKKTLRGWLKHGRVMVDKELVKIASTELEPGQLVSVGSKPSKDDDEGPIPIIYEDAHIVVVNKPIALLSVATHYDDQNTVHRMLKEKYRPGRMFVVHRIDRETSGLLMFARTDKALVALKEMLKEHAIERQYAAIVEGIPEPESGTWECNLKENAQYKVYKCSPDEGVKAITHYKVAAKTAKYAQLDLRLETGRKNQIRAHCQEARTPIVGDMKYGATKDSIQRLCLHAYRLQFEHPMTKQKMFFEAPLPPNFAVLVPKQ